MHREPIWTPRARSSRDEVPKRRIVVDACVAQAAGWRTATHPVSKSCRACLDKILDVCHRIVMARQLSNEWRDHASRYASSWLTTMKSKRKVWFVGELAGGTAAEIWERLQDCPDALKDGHLAVMAISTDRIVISLDDDAKRSIAGQCGDMAAVMDVTWACPQHGTGVIQWPEEGAPQKTEWTLRQC